MRIYLISESARLCEVLANGLKKLLPAGTTFVGGTLSAAKDMIKQKDPSAVVLDIDYSGSFDAAGYIKELAPRYSVPIIVVTASKAPKSSLISAGALDVITKHIGENAEEKLISRLSTSIVSCTKMVRKTRQNTENTDNDKIIVIGGSTGSTNSLPVVLEGLPPDCPPVVCVLHMPEGYTKLYASQLNAKLPHNVIEAVTGTYLKKGMVVIAAGGRHLRVFRDKKGYFITSEEGVKVNGHCPSVDVLFDSAAYAAKENAIGVILTGMGSDGAKGMLDMRKIGAYNIAEAESTAVVYGMPKAAAENGAANISLPLDKIAKHITARLNMK